MPAVAVLLLAFMAPVAGASGTTYDVSTSGGCSGLGGTLSAGTCTLTDVNVGLGVDDLLIVPSGTTLALVNSEVTNFGSEYLNGTVTIDSTSNFNNPGYAYVGSDGAIYDQGTLSNAGDFYNWGEVFVECYGSFFVTNGGYLENDNYIDVTLSGELTIQVNGAMENWGEIDIDCYGTLTNDGGLYNEPVGYEAPWVEFPGAEIEIGHNGNFTNNYLVVNWGIILVNCGGYLTNAGVTIYSAYGAELENYGALFNGFIYEFTSGTISNAGEIDNLPYGDFWNFEWGLVINPGVINEYCGAGIYVPGSGFLTVNSVTYLDPCLPDLKGTSFASGFDTPTISGYLTDGATVSTVEPALSAEGNFSAKVYLADVNTYLGSIGGVGSTVTNASDGSGYWQVKTSPLPAGMNTISACTKDFQNYENCTTADSPLTVVTVVDPTSTAATCAPAGLEVGLQTTCTAYITDNHDGAPATYPLGTVTWSASATGTWSTSNTCSPSPYSTGVTSCSRTFTPGLGSEGPITITASYTPSPAYWLPSSNTAGIAAYKIATQTAVSCATPLIVNVATSCGSTVTNEPPSNTIQSPGGTVAMSNNGASGSFAGVCGLVATLGLASTSCTSNPTFTPAPGTGGQTVQIQGNYGGDANHNTSVGYSVWYTIEYRASATSVVCVPNPDAVNVKTTCTVTVVDATLLGTPITPTGTVTLSASPSGEGTFSSHTCVLSSGKCSVTYKPKPGSEGTTWITASYGGDSSHSGSSGSTGLVVTPRTTSSLITCATPYKYNKPIVCDITVKDTSSGTKITPTGTATVLITGPKSFSVTATCSLSGVAGTAFCTIIFTPTHNGTFTLAMTYPGDINHSASGDTINILVS